VLDSLGPSNIALKKTDDLQSFVEALRVHCENETLIKGWEADRRICVGRDRAALRAAAKSVRQKSFKIGHNALNSTCTTSGTKALSQFEWAYAVAIQQLHEELAKAQESDFDCMLKDGLEWLGERLGLKEETSKYVTATVYDRIGEKLLQKLNAQRACGHRGKAIERDLSHASYLHGVLSQAFDEVDDNEESQYAYLKAVEEFMDELAKRGEPDFDGKLRQAINFLENGGKRLCY
jgi:hypothetical protein